MVTPRPRSAQPPPSVEAQSAAVLTIGDLARRTGLSQASLRMWEARHGYPVPSRLDSGHRRYAEGDVDLVRQVLRRREQGMRLEVAIAQVVRADQAGDHAPGAPSVYAALRRWHPALQPQRLKKSTLMALSWAIEDECCARAERPMIFGAFQKQKYYHAAEERWGELARAAKSSVVFADFAGRADHSPHSLLVQLPADAPMRREWAVICDAPDNPALLTAWELPGQSSTPDKRRLFESVWTVEPAAVRVGARTCAQVAQQLGHPEADELLDELGDQPPPPPTELLQVTSLLNRVVAYVDRVG